MNEPQRQSYLKALGLTPWVARVVLPGAAPSPELAPPEPPPAPEAAPASTEAPRVAVETETPKAPPSLSSELERTPPPAPRPVAREPATPVQAAAQPVAADQALVFTLEAHLAGETWLLFQQSDAKAPGLGRHDGALAASLLAVFAAVPSRPRRFYCPLTDDQPMDPNAASQALTAFVAGLARLDGGQRALFCLNETLAKQVLGTERYQEFKLGEMGALVVSSLDEMLSEPARHKKRSWQAMVESGFHG
ncbi:hypothetical protein B5T_03443 [Alloalcanivorax dieselolei B5]|uniref:Uncharacterized protein n=1 Tax=Alcanivorax dieselolei (strain DSM 16502 / CGMCC 1.3690 / MCCC 1A00001 / B-5) TaxID=930169 RepID=K0CH66_ALCDB|nr:hypothetical protein [Alloalcanivorax dieselolei]AFT71710.1 hypothetical protein B5T_03443 [Alloalcanivorax dieselolei B5]GGJ88615.1 hypothetical protein GCM10007426_17390 [Alloalcanivorax dieselolei]